MSIGRLLASRTVMAHPAAFGFDSDTGNVDAMRFVHPEGGVGFVTMSYEAWDDMGRPTEITVTIEPGDRLNDE